MPASTTQKREPRPLRGSPTPGRRPRAAALSRSSGETRRRAVADASGTLPPHLPCCACARLEQKLAACFCPLFFLMLSCGNQSGGGRDGCAGHAPSYVALLRPHTAAVPCGHQGRFPGQGLRAHACGSAAHGARSLAVSLMRPGPAGLAGASPDPPNGPAALETIAMASRGGACAASAGSARTGAAGQEKADAAATTMAVCTGRCTGRRGFHVLVVLALFVTPAWVVYKRFVATAGLSQKISTDTVPKAGRAVVTTAGLSLRKQVQHSKDSFTAGSTTLKPKEKVDSLVSDNDQPAGAACAWVVLTGDSNTRAVVDQWIGQHMHDGVEKHHTNHAGGTPSCQHTAAAQEYVAKSADPTYRDTWQDKEWMLIDKTNRSKCLIVTLNFLSAQGEAARLVSADGRSYCRTKFQEPQFGTDQTQAKARSKRRPPHPDVIWHFHGLWSLPGGGGGSPEGLNCADRFRADVAAVRAWVHDTPDVVWQTTFPILGHQSIRNPYLLWEYNCQRRSVHVARTQGGGAQEARHVRFVRIRPRPTTRLDQKRRPNTRVSLHGRRR